MAELPEIKTNLFSFKTFRSPDKIGPAAKLQYFIEHPDLSLSNFNACPVRKDRTNASIDPFNDFLASFESFSSYKEVQALDPAFYAFSSELMQQKRNDSSKPDFNNELPEPLSKEIEARLWDELFYQITTQNSDSVRQACVDVILAQHFVRNSKSLKLSDISRLTILVPEIVYNCFRPWQYSECGGKMFGVHNLGIQEYRRVEQTLCCYVPGEVSHIENIMAKEYKEKSTRNLLRTEYTTEFTSETEIENLNDTTSTERNEISSEVAKELQKDKSFDLSGSVTVTKDSKVFGSISANVSSGYSSNNSSSQSNTEAKNYAKEVTERALERVVQKTTEKRTYKMIKEFEEKNKHGFDNRLGEKHVTGVYRWVDKIYDNELVNYGKRLLFESEIPHPASFYKRALLWKSKEDETAATELTGPKTLADYGINTARDLSSENVVLPGSAYGATYAEYETETQYISVDVNPTETSHKSYSQSQTQPSIIIPDGLVAVRIDGTGSFNYTTPSGSAYTSFNFGGHVGHSGEHTDKGTKNWDYHLNLSPNMVGSIPFVISYRRTKSYSGALKVKCISDPALFTEWQEETFAILQTAYQSKLDQYNEELKLQQAAIDAANDQDDNTDYANPALNRLIEERELKRICIEMMSKPYCYEMGKNFNECKTYTCKDECGESESVVDSVIQNEELEKYAKFVKFFETAFQWEILTYVFYPYYYNPKCQWPELIQIKNDDPIFEAFLQSGMAKLLIPVRPQFEKAVMHYMETGEIYMDGDLIPDTNDDRYVSLLTDLGEQDEVSVEGKWKTRVPSTLTIIQANSSYLEDEKGLPCCEDDLAIFGSNDGTLQSINPE